MRNDGPSQLLHYATKRKTDRRAARTVNPAWIIALYSLALAVAAALFMLAYAHGF